MTIVRAVCYNNTSMSNEELMRRYITGDRFVAEAGIEILEVTPEKAVVGAKIEDRHLNANNCVQGGMLFTVADFAFAVLENALHPITVTQIGTISYITAARTDYVTATAYERVRSGHNCVCEVIVKDASGRTVCVCQFNGFIKEEKPEAQK